LRNSSIISEDNVKFTGTFIKINKNTNALFHMGYRDESKYRGTLITDFSDSFILKHA
jgi:hypothetical protein